MTLRVVSFTEMLPGTPSFDEDELMSNIVRPVAPISWWRVNIKHLSNPRHWNGKWDVRKVDLAAMLRKIVGATVTSEE